MKPKGPRMSTSVIPAKIRRSSLSDAPTEQGVYVLWLERATPICLKVGIAGPRRGQGLQGRLALHYSSSSTNSVLARHLAGDSTSPWAGSRDFRHREQRKAFLADHCYFQAVALPDVTKSDLLRIESFLVGTLRPTYAGKVHERPES
jgi:hypothetical protein